MDVVPLLERESQLASLAQWAGEARHGDGRLVLIAGEAGVGKSALVEQLQRGLPEATWCWGACDGLFTPRPLGPLFDIAGTLGGELLELCRAGAAREELFSALLRQVSAPGELHVLVVEDVHWADEATIDLLRFLGRRIRDAPVAAPGHLPGRGPDRNAPAPHRCRRPGDPTARPAHQPPTAVCGRGGGAGRRERAGSRRALPADRRQPVLCQPGRAGRDGRGAGVRPGCGAGPGRAAGQRLAGGAGRGRPDRHPGRACAAGVGR